MLGEHPITRASGHRPRRNQGILTTASRGCRSKGRTRTPPFSCGNSTHRDMTKSTTGTADRQTHAASQVSDIRAEMAELRTHGIKAEGFDTRGQRPKSWRTRPSWTRKAARAALDIALAERECDRALLRNGRWHWCWSRPARMP
jgi:hypothetical protein